MKKIATSQLHILILFLLLNLSAHQAICQGPPLCFQYFFPTVEAQAGDQVTLPLMVRGFEFVAATQFGVYYDSTALELTSVNINTSALPGFGGMNHNLFKPGILLVGWDSDNAMGVSLPDSTVIMELFFKVKAHTTGFFAVKFGDLLPTMSPYETLQLLPPDWRSVFLPLAQQVGGVSIGAVVSNVLTATKTCTNATTCNGTNGTASVEVTGGQAPYIYEWQGPGGFTAANTASISGLKAGDYWATITDQLNNSMRVNIRVSGSAVSIGSNLQVTHNASCGFSNGCATITANNGQPPYSYNWSAGSSIAATNCNLPPGKFYVTVTDALGCSVERASQVGNDTALTLNLTYLNIQHCAELGSAEVTPIGTNDFQYLWSTGDTTRAISGLAAGVYTVLVTKAGICETKQTFEISNLSPTFNLNLAVSNIESCQDKGSAVVSPDGMPPFQYLWSTGATTSAVSELPLGSYGITVTSADGCIASKPFNVANNYYIGWYFGAYGRCSASDPNTGTIRLYYSPLEENAPKPSLVTWGNGVVHAINNPSELEDIDSLVGLPSGIYTVTVTDTEGCTISRTCTIDCAQMRAPDPGMTAFYIKDEYLDTQYSIDSCAGVYAQNFNDIQSLSFSLAWTNGAQFVKVRKFNLPGLDLSDFNFSTGNNRLGINWESLNPVSLPPQTCLFEVCMAPTIEWLSHKNISFADEPVGVKLVGENGQEQAFSGKSGEIMFNLYFPLQPSTSEAGVLPPDCSADGNSQFCVKQSNPDLRMGVQVSRLDANTSSYPSWGYTGSAQRLSAGKYWIKMTQAASEIDGYFVKIPSNLDAGNCVWPGDADNNNVVNHYDLLYIGMAYGAAGHTRPAATLDWSGQEALNWDAYSAVRQVNFKNADTNGDGVINATDTEAILQNWGNVINTSWDNPFASPTNVGYGSLETSICLRKDTLEQGQQAIIPILVGSANTAQDSAYGLAFSVSYDPHVFKGEVNFVPTDSWLGDPSDLLVLQKNNPSQGIIYVGVTRMDGTPIMGYGAIGSLSVQVADDVLNEVAGAQQDLKTYLYFNGINATNAKELTKKLGGGPPTEIVISHQTSAVEEVPGWEKRVKIYPNPAHSFLNIVSPDALLSGIEISDCIGRVVLNKQPDALAYQVPIQELVSGVYIVRIFSPNGVCSKKIVISH